MRLRITLTILAMTFSTLGFAQATNKSLDGTYTFVFGSVNQYQTEYNQSGQQVGFCNGGPIPWTYNCGNSVRQDVITGTLVSNGTGDILDGDYVQTADPNSYQCGDHNPAPDCPYKVPSGIAWSGSKKYVVGDEVDFEGITIQAVVNDPSKPVKSGTGYNVCTANAHNTTCAWVQLYQSATGENTSGSDTFVGTYKVSSNGLGVMVITPSGKEGIGFAFVLPATSGVGQVVGMVAVPSLSKPGSGIGTAVRIK